MALSKEFSFFRDADAQAAAGEDGEFAPFITINGVTLFLSTEVTALDVIGFVAQVSQGGTGAVRAVDAFLKLALAPCWDQFTEVVRKSDGAIQAMELAQIAEGISEEYTGRPTQASSTGR